MRLGGTTEVAQELAISQSRVLVLRQRADFPDPLGEIAQGSIWDLDIVAAWKASGLRGQAGRPSKAESQRTLGGRFLLEVPAIGKGGFADVFRAADKKSGGTVAVKVLRDVASVDAEVIARFDRELRIMQSLKHPNVVPILAHGETDDEQIWYAMPLAQGSLADFAAGSPLTPPVIATIVRQIAAGLQHVHERGVCHRDLKPANVLRLSANDTESFEWAVSDFGLAVQVERETDPLTSTHRQGLGSWVYAAPEQWQKTRTADHRSDIYSLGKIMQALLTDEPPITSDQPPTVLRAVIERATAASPKDRYNSVQDLVDALERAVGAKEVHERWESREEQADRLRERLLSRPGTDDLTQVVRWAEALDEEDDGDMGFLVRVLPWMDIKAVRWTWDHEKPALSRVLGQFAEHVATNSFSFEYCDTLAIFMSRAASATKDAWVLGQMVPALAMLGHHHNRWRVRDVLVGMLQDVRSEAEAAEVIEALGTVTHSALLWSLSEFSVRSLPLVLRADVVRLLGGGA